MKKLFTIIAAVFLTQMAAAQSEASVAASKATLAISKIEATGGVLQKAKRDGSSETLRRVLESLDSDLLASVQQTRKFEVVSRSDLDAVMKEASFAESGNVADDKNSPKAGGLKGAKYIITVAVSDFQDFTEKAHFSTLEKTVERRILRFGVVAKVIDTQNGSIYETVRLDVSNEDVSETDVGVVKNGNLNDALIGKMSNALADRIALKICDIAFPAKVVAVRGNIVTINRGEGSGVKAGQVYEIFAVGEKITDPDTGEFLGLEEVGVGFIEIERVHSKMSQGSASVNNGIAFGQIARLSESKK